MGKRKSSKPPPKKVKAKLDVAFSCPFCNSDKSVTATMDWNNEVRASSCLLAIAIRICLCIHIHPPVPVIGVAWLNSITLLRGNVQSAVLLQLSHVRRHSY